MEEYRVTYFARKEGGRYTITRSCDRTLPPFLQGGHGLIDKRFGREVTEDIESVLLKRAKKTKKPIKLELTFRVTE